MVVASARSGLSVALGVLLFRRLSLLLLVVIAGPQPLLWLFCEGPVWLQLLPQLWSPLVVGFIVGGLDAPCASWPCVLRGVRSFRTRGGFAACLLLAGAPGFRSIFVLLRPSLTFCSSLLQPLFHLGAGLFGYGVCLVGAVSPRVRASLSFIVRRLFVPLRILGGWRPVIALSRLRGGVPALLLSVAPSQSILPALSGALGGLPGSLLCLPHGSGSSSFCSSLWFWHGASAIFISGPTLGLSSAPWLFHRILPPVSSVLPLLGSCLLCSLAGWLVLGSAFQVLVEAGPSSSACVVSSAS